MKRVQLKDPIYYYEQYHPVRPYEANIAIFDWVVL